MKCKTQTINKSSFSTVHGDRLHQATDRDIRGLQMAPPLTPPPLHECHLLFDKGPWPVKSEQYTVISHYDYN